VFNLLRSVVTCIYDTSVVVPVRNWAPRHEHKGKDVQLHGFLSSALEGKWPAWSPCRFFLGIGVRITSDTVGLTGPIADLYDMKKISWPCRSNRQACSPSLYRPSHSRLWMRESWSNFRYCQHILEELGKIVETVVRIVYRPRFWTRDSYNTKQY
jgi:hypothetical protein